MAERQVITGKDWNRTNARSFQGYRKSELSLKNKKISLGRSKGCKRTQCRNPVLLIHIMDFVGAEEKSGPNRERQETPSHSSKTLNIKHFFLPKIFKEEREEKKDNL
jgi:hypothetical protein